MNLVGLWLPVETARTKATLVCLQSLSQQASFYGYSNAEPNQPRKLGWVTLRTRYLDDALVKAFALFQGKPCQAVLLGAGMDARPWRLPSMHSVRFMP